MSALRSFKRQTDEGMLLKALNNNKKGTKFPLPKQNKAKVLAKVARRARKALRRRESLIN